MAWDKESIVRELRRLYRLRADLSFTAVRGSAVWGAAFRCFGSWRRAVEAAGIDYRRVWRRRLTKWDEPRVAGELRRLRKGGQDLSDRAMRRDQPALHSAAIRRFGSWGKAVAAAGIDYGRVRRQVSGRWDRGQVVRDLQRLRREGRPMHLAAVGRQEPALMAAAYRSFGTWRKACEAAGIDYGTVRARPPRVWDRELILSELRDREQDGTSVWRAAVRAARPDLLRAAERCFGSYAAAVRAAGIEYPPKKPLRHWTEPLVLQTLRDLQAQGVDLRHAPMKRRRLPLFEAARYYFGSWENALRQAGIDYAGVVRQGLGRPAPAPAGAS